MGKNSPVDRHDDGIQRKARRIQAILIPYRLSEVYPLTRGVSGIVDRYGDGEQPCQYGKDLVRDNMALGILLPLQKRVDCARNTLLAPIGKKARTSKQSQLRI